MPWAKSLFWQAGFSMVCRLLRVSDANSTPRRYEKFRLRGLLWVPRQGDVQPDTVMPPAGTTDGKQCHGCSESSQGCLPF